MKTSFSLSLSFLSSVLLLLLLPFFNVTSPFFLLWEAFELFAIGFSARVVERKWKTRRREREINGVEETAFFFFNTKSFDRFLPSMFSSSFPSRREF